MRYHHHHGTKHSQNKLQYLIMVVCLAAILVGAYVLFLVLVAPRMTPQINQSYLTSHQPKIGQDQLYIPKINLSVPIKTGGAEALNDAVWHRYPERGDPLKGGNFILAGHRFVMGLTPGEVRHKSPFYNVNQLDDGDLIFVDFNGQRYTYKISRRYSVKPTQVSIEDPSPNNQHMTLYTCSLKGQADGRVVIDAQKVDNSNS
jgi:sortase A